MVKEILELKRRGAENDEVQSIIDTGELDVIIPDMFKRLDRAYDRSKIPEMSDKDVIEDINDFLVELRVVKIGH